jgi:hypothetical protein
MAACTRSYGEAGLSQASCLKIATVPKGYSDASRTRADAHTELYWRGITRFMPLRKGGLARADSFGSRCRLCTVEGGSHSCSVGGHATVVITFSSLEYEPCGRYNRCVSCLSVHLKQYGPGCKFGRYYVLSNALLGRTTPHHRA